jgi:hypothetical protein
MTLFEYLSVALSIILSLAAIRLVNGLRNGLSAGTKYWVHTLWIVVLLGTCLAHWWTSWSFRTADWTFTTFVLMLSGPALLYFVAGALVAEGEYNPKIHFFEKRVQFYAGLFCYMVLITFDGYLILGAPLLELVRIGQVFGALLAILGLASSNATLHKFLAVLFCLLFLVSIFGLVDRPDAIVS